MFEIYVALIAFFYIGPLFIMFRDGLGAVSFIAYGIYSLGLTGLLFISGGLPL